MKKFIMTLSTVIMLMGLVIGTMALTGCNPPAILTLFEGPTNEWCEKEIEYKDTNITAYMMYCDGKYKPNKPTVQTNELDWTKKGLYIVVTGYNEETKNYAVIDALTDKTFAVLFWPEGKTLEVSDVDDDDEGQIKSGFLNVKCSKFKWGLLYNSDIDVYESADDRVPFILRDGNGYTCISGNALRKLSWKKILAKILIDKLLDE